MENSQIEYLTNLADLAFKAWMRDPNDKQLEFYYRAATERLENATAEQRYQHMVKPVN